MARASPARGELNLGLVKFRFRVSEITGQTVVSRCRPFPSFYSARAREEGKRVWSSLCRSFRVGGMQLTLYVYVAAAN